MSDRKWHQNPWAWCGCGCCLGVILVPLLLGSLGIGGAFWALRKTTIQAEALDLAKANPQVVERLGEPLEIGWLMSGNISFENDEGSADYSIPISGPNGKGKLFVEAYREDSEWVFEELFVRIDGDRIDLVGGNALPLPADAAAALPSEEGSETQTSDEVGGNED